VELVPTLHESIIEGEDGRMICVYIPPGRGHEVRAMACPSPVPP